MTKLGFIGAGTVGSALALRLKGKGYQVAAVSSRSFNSARRLADQIEGCQAFESGQDVSDNADLVFITTPDGAIAQVASQVKWHTDQGVVHCSGADSTLTLEPARRLGARVGAFHPLQTFASLKEAIQNIPGSTFAIEAQEPLRTTLKEIAEALDGDFIELKAEDKVLYHAAAVIACNYLVTLIKLSSDLWQTFDVERLQAIKALMPLIKGTLHNIEHIGIPDCLTGPIARGDTGTIEKHLDALKDKTPELIPVYRELGLQTIPIALAKGKIDEVQAKKMQTLLVRVKIIER